MPAFLLSFFHFSFEKVGLQVDGNLHRKDFRKLSGNCTMIFLLFRRSELRAVLSFWIFEASFLLSCLLSTYGKCGLL